MTYKDPEEQRAYQLEWIAKRRDAWFKENGPCRKCGSWVNLQLDHIDRNKKVSHNIWSWSQERQDTELAKCQPLCEECHKEKTSAELRVGHEHGNAGYRTGCRCDICRAWKVADNAAYREFLRKRKAIIVQ